MPDPTALLRADHRLVERLLDDIEKAKPAARPPLVEQLTTSLKAHMKLEEDVLYPVIATTLGDKTAHEAEVEHELAKTGLNKVRSLMPDAPGFVAALDMLRAGIQHHVKEEEGSIFLKLKQKLNATQKERVAADMDTARARLGLPTRKDVGTKASRDELYQKAQKAGIPGRSTMTKEELATVLAGSGRRR